MRNCVFILSFFLLHMMNVYAIVAVMPADSIGQLPQGAVPFSIYRGNIILDGALNDSIQIKALFDTGAWGIAVPAKYKTSEEPKSNVWPPKDREHLRIGNWEQDMIATYTTGEGQFLQWFKGECVLLGWDFFDRKILEISYKKQYIRILEQSDLHTLSGYDCVSFRERGKRLLIPVTMIVQGKKIEGDCWIDTGLNGTLFLTHNIPALYNLDVSKSRSGRAKGLEQKSSTLNILQSDTIRIGNNHIAGREVLFTDEAWSVFKENDMYIGLIGNQFFYGFSVIFDFEKKKLYLKPEEE